MASRATLALRNPATPVVASPYGATDYTGKGQIVSTPAPNQHAFGYQPQIKKPQGYGALGNNMPVGVANGNQTYNYGLQQTAPGQLGTVLADPRVTTAFSGRTAPTALTSGGSDGRVGTAAPRAVPTLRAGSTAGYGGVPTGVAGGAPGIFSGAGGTGNVTAQSLSDQLQKDQDTANAQNKQNFNDAINANATGYGGIYDTINAGKTEQTGLVSGLGATQKELNNRNTNVRLGQSQQNEIGNGLGNSTVVGSMAKGIQSEGDFQNQAVDEANARLQLGIDQNSTNQMVGAQTGAVGQKVGLISSQTVQGPNTAAYLALLGRAGATGGAGAAGVGGYGGVANGGGSGIGGTGTGFGLTSPNGNQTYTGDGNVNSGSSGLGNNQQQNQPPMLPAPQMPVPYYPYDYGQTTPTLPAGSAGDYPSGGTSDYGTAGDAGESGVAGQSGQVSQQDMVDAVRGIFPSLSPAMLANPQYVASLYQQYFS